MIMLNARCCWQIRRFHAACVLLFCCAISFTIGCKRNNSSVRPSGENSTAATAQTAQQPTSQPTAQSHIAPVTTGLSSENSTDVRAIEEYKTTDLPFHAEFVVEKGGGFERVVTKEGKVKTSCFKVALENGLSLGNHSIPLKSNDVTTDCMIQTKDYGSLQTLQYSSGRYSTKILVTPTQEKQFRKLAQQ